MKEKKNQDLFKAIEVFFAQRIYIWFILYTGGLRYWSKDYVPPQLSKIENNKPYLIPRLPHKFDASNVETTAYALLVHVKKQAVIQKEIVKWLNTQRSTDGGWASTQVILFI